MNPPVNTLIEKQQNSIFANILNTTLIEKLDSNFALFFLKELEKFSSSPQNLTSCKIFLERYFSLFAGSIFCIFSRHTATETEILIAIAQYCSDETRRPVTDFLLPGVSLSNPQQQMSIEDLLQTHIISDCRTQLKNALELFSLDEKNPDFFHEKDFIHLKNHSLKTRLFYSLVKFEQASSEVFILFLALLDEFIIAVSEPASCKDIVLNFCCFCEKGLSEHLWLQLPKRLRENIETICNYFNSAFIKSPRKQFLMMPPELLASLIDSYHCCEQELLQLRKNFEEYPHTPDYREILLNLISDITSIKQKNIRHGFINSFILQQINSPISINCRADLKILEHIPAYELTHFLRFSDNNKLIKQIVAQLTPYQLILLVSHLEINQAKVLMESISTEELSKICAFFEEIPAILYFFQYNRAYAEIIKKALAPAVPHLLENSLERAKKEGRKYNNFQKIIEKYACDKVISDFLREALQENLNIAVQKSFIHDLIRHPHMGSGFTHSYWQCLFQNNPASINHYLPRLPREKRNELLTLIAELVSHNKMAINLQIFFSCLKDCNALNNKEAYRQLIEYARNNDYREICKNLSVYNQPEIFIPIISEIFFNICGPQEYDAAHFLKSALSFPENLELFLDMRTFPDLLLLIREHYQNSQLISLLFDELYHQALFNPTFKSSPQILTLCLQEPSAREGLLALPCSSLQRFSNNVSEYISVLKLLVQYKKVMDEAILGLYATMINNNFSTLIEKINQESINTRLQTLLDCSLFIFFYDQSRYLLFFELVFEPIIATQHQLFITQRAEIIFDFLSTLQPAEQKKFIILIMESSSFLHLSPEMIGLIFSFSLQHLRHYSDLNLVDKMRSLSAIQRSSCYDKLSSFNLQRDKKFLFSMSDVLSYWQNVTRRAADCNPMYYDIVDFFTTVSNIQKFVSQPRDWLDWFYKVPDFYQKKALADLLKTQPADILCILTSPFVRESFSRLTPEVAAKQMTHSFFKNEKNIVRALIRLNCKHQRFFEIASLTNPTFRESYCLKPYVVLLLNELISTSEEVQYNWLCFLLTNYLKELHHALQLKKLSNLIFNNALSELNNKHFERLIRSATQSETLMISILLRLGLPQKDLTILIYYLPACSYLNVWESIKNSYSIEEYEEFFKILHEDLDLKDCSELLHRIFLYAVSVQNLPAYEIIFKNIATLCPLSYDQRALIRYFSDKQQLFTILSSNVVPKNIQDKLKDKILSKNGYWIKYFNITTADLSERHTLFDADEFSSALSYAPISFSSIKGGSPLLYSRSQSENSDKSEKNSWLNNSFL